jgi:eukaryotic-like serine/threonine-protein kinase
MTAADTIRDIEVEVKRCGECGARFGVEAAFCPFCGLPLVSSTWDPSHDPLTGTIVDDRYEVLGPLGEGGMGTVYKVRHVTLNRLFAMKALRRDLAADGALSERFILEARATAAIKHPAVVAITDFGVLSDGIPYFVMELLVGETLSARLRARGPVPPRDAIDIARKIADGLVASHAAKVIHRDLKPENVFLTGQGDVRIVDFGAAKIVGSSKLTRPGVVFGTPYYMSPEQAGGQPIDGRADVYSLGVLLFEMITGRVPFEADTYMGVLTKHMFAQPPRPSAIVAPGIQLGALEDVVMRALEKEPSARYASMADFARALGDADRGRAPIEAPDRGPPVSRTMPLPKLNTADRIELSVAKRVLAERRRTRKPWATLIVAAAATTTLGLVALSALVGRRPEPKAVPPSVASVAPSPPPPATPAEPTEARPPELPEPTPSAATVEQPTPPPASPRPAATAKAAPAKASPTKAPPTAKTAPAPATSPAVKRSDEFADPWRK